MVLSVIAAFELVEADAAVLLHRQVGDAIAVLFEVLAGVEHGLVLGDAGDDVVALLAIHLGDALDREVVGFGRAAREDDFLRVGADQIGDLLARFVDGLFRFPAERMIAARRVAEMLGEIRHHRFDHARIDGRCRVVVHVDWKFDWHRFIPLGVTSVTSVCVVPRRAERRPAADPRQALRSCIPRARPESVPARATTDRARCISRTDRTGCLQSNTP